MHHANRTENAFKNTAELAKFHILMIQQKEIEHIYFYYEIFS